MWIAASGTPPPSFATKPANADWIAAGFRAVGYTESGVDIVTTPATKDFTPDEAIAPILTTVTGIKVEVKATLWETNLENINVATALSSLSNPGLGIKTLSVGSGNPLLEWAIGIQSASPGQNFSDGSVTMVWRVNVTSAISLNRSRKDIAKLACTFNALTDSSKSSGVDVYETIDFTAGS